MPSQTTYPAKLSVTIEGVRERSLHDANRLKTLVTATENAGRKTSEGMGGHTHPRLVWMGPVSCPGDCSPQLLAKVWFHRWIAGSHCLWLLSYSGCVSLLQFRHFASLGLLWSFRSYGLYISVIS